MNGLGKIAVCLAGGLVLSAGARAGDVASPGNPYVPIVTRNMFGLNPAPTNTSVADDAQLPKITPNGIMSIFGQLQVLFKVAPKAGQKDAKEECYVLSEGQRQDDIEVMHIDEKDSLVTFNNHGTVQEIPLANAPAINLPVPAGGGIGGGRIPLPSHLGGNRPDGGGGGGGPATRFGGQNRGMGGGGPTLNSVPTRTSGGYSGQPAQSTLSPEGQILMIEANRMLTQEQVNQGTLPPLPPTPMTPPDATRNNGLPLTTGPPEPP